MRNLGVVGILLLLVVLVAAAWLSNFPDSAAVHWAAELPWVGRWIGEAQEAYLRASRAAESEDTIGSGPRPASSDPTPRPGVDSPLELRQGPEAVPFVWVHPGMELRAEPEAAAPVLTSVEVLANVPLFQRRGDWFEVRFHGVDGWVRGAEVLESPPLGSAPAPVLPLPGRPPDPERLREAVAPFVDGGAAGALGPYPLYTDFEDRHLLEWLDRVAGAVEQAYRTRYGVAPIDRPREAIVLYRKHADFEALRRQLPLHEGRITGLTGEGLVAIDGGGLAREQLGATLIHEVAHLLNRRALGPALPPWLDEGIARDLGSLAVAATGELVADRIGGSASRDGDRVVWLGGQASLVQLRGLRSQGALLELSRLLALEREDFYSEALRELRYDQSAFFIRYLLEPEGELVEGFRAYLRSISKGGPATAAALAERLDVPWPDLDRAFDTWLAAQSPLQPPELAPELLVEGG